MDYVKENLKDNDQDNVQAYAQAYAHKIDLHTHTIYSGHAVNSIEDMVESARKKGIRLYGFTDHTKTMPDSSGDEYFKRLVREKEEIKKLGKKIIVNSGNVATDNENNKGNEVEGNKSACHEITDNEIIVLVGSELNIISYDGKVDMDEDILKGLDYNIASIHPNIGYTTGSIKENTRAYIGAMKNPYVNIIGHPDDGRIEVDYEEFVKAAKEYGTIIELNNNSLNPEGFRPNTVENSTVILGLCEKYGVEILIGSDAHREQDVGRHERAEGLIDKIGFPKELVLNYDVERCMKRLKGVKKI